MSNNSAELNRIEMDIDQARKSIARHAALTRLHDNEDFQTVIKDGYLEAEAVRAVSVLAEPALIMQGEIQVQMIKDIITGIGVFRQYLIKIEQMGNMASDAMASYVETQAEIVQENSRK